MKNGSLKAALAVAVFATALAGCESLRSAAGMDKSAPDEFAVTTKAPLVIPPDYNLMPPRPGAVPTNQVDPTNAAEDALFGNDPATIAAQLPNSYSETEKVLLANAKVQNIDPQVRQHLASDNKNVLAADDGFTNDILFWQKPKADSGAALDADKEAKRIDAERAGQPPAPGAAPPPPAAGATADQPPKPADAKPAEEKKEGKGWFDGWFDWF